MVICEAILSIAFKFLLVNLTTQGYRMAMSREIPIRVHPEFRRPTKDEQGKPRIFNRSSSLPSRPKLNLVRESLDPNKFHKQKASKEDHKETVAESPSQGTNGTKRNQNYAFWKANMPVDYPRVKHGPCKQNVSEGREQRRYFFTENPFIGDLEKVFEDHYNSDRRPVKLGRRNTYSAGSSRETHHSEPTTGRNFTERNKKGTSFDVPIQVEFDKIKDCDDLEKKISSKPHHSEPQTGRSLTARNNNGISFEIPIQVEFDEERNIIDMEKESSPEPHQSQPTLFGKNFDHRNIQEAFFDIPIQVEFDEVKDGCEIKDKDLEEGKVTGRENSVLDTELTTTPVLEVNTEQSEPFDVVSFNGLQDCDRGENDKDLDQFNSECNETSFGEGNEGKENTQKCQVEVEDGEQSQPVSSSCLPQDLEYTEENESKNKLLTIQSIQKKAEGLERKVNAFNESSKTKEYLILEEVLTCCLIELDGIETNRDENIRLARKTAVQQLQKTLARLEQKVSCRTVENSKY